MKKVLNFRRVIHVPHGWDDSLWRRRLAFWNERGFRFEDRHGSTQQGRRGSLWGNYTAFDMEKVRTSLILRRIDVNTVEFVMEVDTRGQIIMEWNERHWQMEMETLETWLLVDDDQEARWRAFGDHCRRANWCHCLTLGLFGIRLPPD